MEAAEEGRYRSAAETAEAEGVTRSFVNRLVRLTLLAPDLQEAIDGSQFKAIQLEELRRAMPSGLDPFTVAEDGIRRITARADQAADRAGRDVVTAERPSPC